MNKIYEKKLIQSYIEKSNFQTILTQLNIPLFLVYYEKNELVTSPLQDELLFQIVVQGSLNIYFIRDDGTKYSLSSGDTDFIIGDLDFFFPQSRNSYAEAAEPLICIAFPMNNKNKECLRQNNLFLQLIGQSVSQKILSITDLNVSPSTLTERVLTYMKYKCDNGILRGLERAAFYLHCSPRQLQRIMNQCEYSGLIKKIGKGTYQLISQTDQQPH